MSTVCGSSATLPGGGDERPDCVTRGTCQKARNTGGDRTRFARLRGGGKLRGSGRPCRDLPLDQFAREGPCLEIRVCWLPETLWFVPDERDAAGLAREGVGRGPVWTARELAVLMALSARTCNRPDRRAREGRHRRRHRGGTGSTSQAWPSRPLPDGRAERHWAYHQDGNHREGIELWRA